MKPEQAKPGPLKEKKIHNGERKGRDKKKEQEKDEKLRIKKNELRQGIRKCARDKQEKGEENMK
jgi:hypothetical protein